MDPSREQNQQNIFSPADIAIDCESLEFLKAVVERRPKYGKVALAYGEGKILIGCANDNSYHAEIVHRASNE